MGIIDRAAQRLGGEFLPNAEPSLRRQAPRGRQPVEGVADDRAMAVDRIPSTPPPDSSQVVDSADTVHLDFLRMQRAGLLTPGNEGLLAREFRIIKRPVIARAFGGAIEPVRNGRRVMVSSAHPGEGKTFSSINLAVSLASEMAHSVLLIDGDVLRPSIPAKLGFELGPGLTDWLASGSLGYPTGLIRPTNMPRLSVLTAGSVKEGVTELLASSAMESMLAAILAARPEQLIVIDTPPLLLSTEARAIALSVGQVVLVVEAGRTSAQAVQEAIAAAGTATVNLMLNKSPRKRTLSYGGGYGYGDYASKFQAE